MDEFQIAKLDLKAGDILVVKYRGRLSKEVNERILENFARVAPGTPTICIDDSLDMAVLTRTEIWARIG